MVKELSVDNLVAIEDDDEFIEALRSVRRFERGQENPYTRVKKRVDAIRDGERYIIASQILDRISRNKGQPMDSKGHYRNRRKRKIK